MDEKIESLQEQLSDKNKKVEVLENLLKRYEENGAAKLYYALSRKSWEMADMLNAVNLKDLALDDPKNKTFERIRFIINDSSGIAASVKALSDIINATGDESKDIKRRMTSPESVAQEIGDYKTQNV